MRVHVIFAHPVETSFGATLHRTVVDTLSAVGHEVDDCDLYAEHFSPLLTREERLNYHDTALNTQAVAPYVERLRTAEALVFVFPTWNFGYPAILKGYFDRVFLPGVAFDIRRNGKLLGLLNNIHKIAVVTTYGGNRMRAMLAGDPPRKLMTRAVPAYTNFRAPVQYLAQYDMNNMTEERGRRFIKRVRLTMARF